MSVTAEGGLGLGWASIAEVDPDLWAAMVAERVRQHRKIELIASENYVFAAVMEAQGSWLTNKYAEGLPGRRYYGGCEPGGAPANMAAYMAVLEPGDRFMGMNLAHGGHLTHGMHLNFSGRLYEVHPYGVREDDGRIHYAAPEAGGREDDGRIDYDAREATAREVRPKLIVAGASAYPRIIDFERMAAVAHEVGALLMGGMAHIAGLGAAGGPSP